MTQQYGRQDYREPEGNGDQRDYDRDYGQYRGQPSERYRASSRELGGRDEDDRRQRDFGYRGNYGRRLSAREREGYERGYGGSGSDYRTNGYDRGESRYGSPYSEMSNRELLSGDERTDPYGIVATNWERTRAVGEWTTGPISTEYDDPYARIYSGPTRTNFRGLGPKGYERTDERTREVICEALTEAPHIDASDITVEVKGGEVKLTGSVRDRRTKYAVEDLVEGRTGTAHIRNELRVDSADRVAPTLYSTGTQRPHDPNAKSGAVKNDL